MQPLRHQTIAHLRLRTPDDTALQSGKVREAASQNGIAYPLFGFAQVKLDEGNVTVALLPSGERTVQWHDQ